MRKLTHFFQFLAICGAVASGVIYYLTEASIKSIGGDLAAASALLNLERSKTQNLQKAAAEKDQRLAEAESRFEQSRSEVAAVEARYNQLRRENARFVQELETRKKREEELLQSNADISRELAQTRAASVTTAQVADYETKIGALESEILKLRDTQRSFPGSIARPAATPAPASPRLVGNVLTVGKQSSFVVIDLGYQKGIRMNDELVISQDGLSIAKIQVSEVKENLSIARIVPDSLGGTPMVGDEVATLN